MSDDNQQLGALPYLGGFDGNINPDKWIDYMVMSCLAASTTDAMRFVHGVAVLQALMSEKLSQNTKFVDGMRAASLDIKPDSFRVDDDGQEQTGKMFKMSVVALSLIVQQIEHRQLIHIAAGLRPGEGAANHASVKPEEQKEEIII